MGDIMFVGQTIVATPEGLDVAVGVPIFDTDIQDIVQGGVAQIRRHHSTTILRISTRSEQRV